MRLSEKCAVCLYDKQKRLVQDEDYLAEVRELLANRDVDNDYDFSVVDGVSDDKSEEKKKISSMSKDIPSGTKSLFILSAMDGEDYSPASFETMGTRIILTTSVLHVRPTNCLLQRSSASTISFTTRKAPGFFRELLMKQ